MYACIYCDPDFSCTRTYIQPEVVQEVLADLKRSPVRPRYPEGDPFGNNASVGSLFWVSICSSAACFPGSGLNEELGKMEEPGLNFCRARFAIVSSTCCNFFAFFLPPALNQHLIAACQCQNKSLVHFLLQEKAIFQSQFLKKRAKN